MGRGFSNGDWRGQALTVIPHKTTGMLFCTAEAARRASAKDGASESAAGACAGSIYLVAWIPDTATQFRDDTGENKLAFPQICP
jgi:hypothetical protein